MKKSFTFRVLNLCVAVLIFANMGFHSVIAKENDDIIQADSNSILNGQDIIQENEYIESNSRIIVKYLDEHGERVDAENKIYINQVMETIVVDPNIAVDTYMYELKASNDNIEYVQIDYKLVLSNINENKEVSEVTDITEKTHGMEADDTASINSQADEIVVAVIDSGIDISHEAISESIWYNPYEVSDGSDDDDNGYIDDTAGWDFVNNIPLCYEGDQIVDYSHGTHIAGIISGKSDEIQNVHSSAQIMPLKAFKDGSAYTSDIIRAIEYADLMGASIVNCSFGSNDKNIALKDVMESTNMLFVCAAGNHAVDIDEVPFYPASFDCENIIAVAATDENNNIAYFSNYGKSVDIAVNGVSIKSSVPENEYGNSSGTSAATAYISGIVAGIVMDRNAEDPEIIKQVLQETSFENKAIDEKAFGLRIFPASCGNNMLSNDTDAISDATVYSDTQANDVLRGLNQIKDISAGGYHSVVLTTDSTYIFGDNSNHQCSGQYTLDADFVLAPGFANFDKYCGSVKKVSARGDHTLYLMSDGTVRCLGANNYGQLGVGYTGVGEYSNDSTEQVLGLSNIVDIAAGHQFSLALDSSGRVYAWGNNKDGQVGNGNSYAFFYAPQLVNNLTNVKNISAGHYHALAQTDSGDVYGWGRAYNGALGEQKNEKYYSPILLDIDNVDKIVAGLDNSFFIKNDKSVYACGNNAYGQLGDGTLNARTDFLKIDIENIIDISSNISTIFLSENGSAFGCGNNSYGQLGLGYVATSVKDITQIPGIYTAVSTGGTHTLFLKDDELYASGRNHKAQSGGSNDGDNYVTPTLVSEFSKDAFTIEEIEVNYSTNTLVFKGKCFLPVSFALVYVGDEFNSSSSLYSSTRRSIYMESNGNYTHEYELKSPINGINHGWIKLEDYPYKIYFSFMYDASQQNIIAESDITVEKGQPCILAVTVTDMSNIKDKVFTLDYDSTKLLLQDACSQTWKKDTSVGEVEGTDIEILALSDSQIKFKTNKTQSPISGTINMLSFSGLLDGTATVTVTIE